jgi:predicted NBD/HSP70 family sugar kinase
VNKIKHEIRICQMLWQHPNLSRVEICKKLNVDKSTVSIEVSRLIEQGIIIEHEEEASGMTGGRRPIPLTINKNYGITIGIAIQSGQYTAVAINLAGEILEVKEEFISITKDNLALNIQLIYWEFRNSLDKYPGILMGVGIGVGGLVNQQDGTILYSVPLKITESFNFIKTISQKLETSFVLGNNANCCAWGELAFHKNKDLKNILFVLVEFKQAIVPHEEYGGVGIGFGIVLNGKVHYGSNSSAGEFRSVLCSQQNGLQVSLTKEELSRILTDKSVLDKFATELSKNIAMLVNTLDFSQIFVGGDIENCDFDFCHILEEKIQENWMYPLKKNIGIHYSSLGAKSVAFGAAGMFIQHLFSINKFPVASLD